MHTGTLAHDLVTAAILLAGFATVIGVIGHGIYSAAADLRAMRRADKEYAARCAADTSAR